MKFGYLLYLLMLVLPFGCDQLKKEGEQKKPDSSLSGTWHLADVIKHDTGNDDEMEDGLLQKAKDKEIIKQGIALSFFKDGTYTELRGGGFYKWGRWKYSNDKKSLLLSDSVTTTPVLLTQQSINNHEAISLLNKSTKEELKFIKSAQRLKDYNEDPFYYKNNLWRIKPLRAETKEGLKSRLGNYFKHLLYILKSSKERAQDIISFTFSQGIVRIYNGGIGIVSPDDVPETWVNTFYNKTDAGDAYRMFQRYLVSSTYKGAATGDWVDDDYNILLSIYGDLKEGKF